MKKVWLLIDNRIGSAGQARGVGLKLENDFEVIEKQIEYNSFAKVPNFIKGASLLGIKKQSIEDISKNYPDLVISASRRTAPVARWIKKQSKKTKIIQLMYAGKSGLSEFDLVFVPNHDNIKNKTENMRFMFGAPHRLTKEKLAEAKKQWQKEFEKLPKPLTAVLVGGGINLDEQKATNFGVAIKNLKDKIGGSILITTSKRTGDIAQNAIMKEIAGIDTYEYLWGKTEGKENPFLGYLACCDNVIVTGDSVSMASEACGTGQPVFVSVENCIRDKHVRFVNSLFEERYACSLYDNDASLFKPRGILDTATEVGLEIKKLFK